MSDDGVDGSVSIGGRLYWTGEVKAVQTYSRPERRMSADWIIIEFLIAFTMTPKNGKPIQVDVMSAIVRMLEGEVAL